LTRILGDLDLAEDALQDACAAAVVAWTEHGIPANPLAWLVSTARHKALDWQRREARRPAKEALATVPPSPSVHIDQLGLIVMCCHPALDPGVRVALTLRAVCGLSTGQLARAFLTAEPTMAQRLVRGKRKIREAGIRFGRPDDLGERLPSVLRTVYLIYTAGHRDTATPAGAPTAVDLRAEAIRLARDLHALLPGEAEPAGLLALLLLTEARQPGRFAADGHLVLLAEQDRSTWNRALIAEGAALLRPDATGRYQLQAAIAACHSSAATAEDTDWARIASLYEALYRVEPTAVVAANRAVAVSMVDGPAAGLAMLDRLLAGEPKLGRWAPLHVGRADFLRRLGRAAEADAAVRAALASDPSPAERAHLEGLIRD
jgi:RNA polymerase sigma-70 factor (ECF subfamily)